MAWAAEQRTGSPARKAVLMALTNCANHQTGDCHPSVPHLADETELGDSTVRRALKELEAAGLIGRERIRFDETQRYGGYVYTFPLVPALAAATGDLQGKAPDQAADGAAGATGQSQRSERAVHNKELEPGTISPRGASSAPPTAQEVLAVMIDRARKRGVELLPDVKGQYGRKVKRLLDQGIAARRIVRGFDLQLDRVSLGAQNLPQFINQAELPPPKSGQQNLLDYIKEGPHD